MWENEVTLCHNYLQVTLEQGVVPVSSPRDHEVPGWRPAGASLSHGYGGLFSLGWQPLSDGVTIKKIPCYQITQIGQSHDFMMSNKSNQINDVNESGSTNGEAVTSGMDCVTEQAQPDRHSATVAIIWIHP